ncbi:hypothetical protein GCM10011316_10580 [Roseibium aquae]|uniref:Uncharacterized protein n=1 Tax=Roseibium aquae TaxID=1323746 RepID=A0A916TEJ8_9HYPH|nr:hypothetical protein [Roseibium aquae]GGB40393.1 hypothetical protein GCM10011316_10580 [Roseibium aquae]
MVSRICLGLSVSCLLVALCGPAPGFAEGFETPPVQDPEAVLGDNASGPGYGVLAPIRSDGFLRLYELRTDRGIERISGDGLLHLRINDIRALMALQGLEANASFMEGLKEAARKPGEFIESAIEDPAGTARSTVSGVGRLFGRVSRGVSNVVTGHGGSPEDLAKAITGQDRARRELAVQIGVDPYTAYAPLAEKLDQTASVTTAGEWTVSAITALLPGGMVVGLARSAESFRTMIIDSTPAELRDRTAATFAEAGVSPDIVQAFFQNPHYTQTEQVIFAYRLNEMTGVGQRSLLVERAADARTRDEAYFHLRRIVLTETYHRETAPLSQFKIVAGYPIALRLDGAAALVAPLDMVSWTETTSAAFTAIAEAFERQPFPPTRVDFVMTGDITDTAAVQIASFGWEVTANMPMPEGPVK